MDFTKTSMQISRKDIALRLPGASIHLSISSHMNIDLEAVYRIDLNGLPYVSTRAHIPGQSITPLRVYCGRQATENLHTNRGPITKGIKARVKATNMGVIHHYLRDTLRVFWYACGYLCGKGWRDRIVSINTIFGTFLFGMYIHQKVYQKKIDGSKI
ncbi:hypothetical protein CEXT_171501 [Caerostris extrusa]|uniref:Uncharacterized protein n=1 Tax=Caerostris extrusa TaxID=172846 RepID=A0AAV4QTZ1_CAEEX|nr:hypothetical protein CEXT_171501 [Caerostris extrusa]